MALSFTAFGLTGCGSDGDADNAGGEFDAAALDETLTAVADRDDGKSLVGMAVEVFRDGEVVYKFATGNRYIDNENPDNNLPYTNDTKQRIASVSKTFTAVGIMQLVEQGKIDLDADISDYLGFELRNPEYPDVPITCRMLLSHTSSILDGDVYSIAPNYSISEFFKEDGEYYEDGGHFDMEHEPGTYFEYSNLGFGTLGTIIEAVSGERFDKYMTAHILEPMGFTASFNVGDFDEETISLLAAAYQKDLKDDGTPKKDSDWNALVDDYHGETVEADTCMVSNPDTASGFELVSLADYTPGTNATCQSPQGGLRISSDELAQWALMFANDGATPDGGQLLKPETVDQMFSVEWEWNGKDADKKGSNGNPEYGLFQQWGLGIQLITNGKQGDYGDTFLEDANIENLGGHYGDAYGMFDIFMVDRDNDCGFTYQINGANVDIYNEPSYGNYSENWIWEEEIVTAIYDTILSDYKVEK